MKLFPPPSQVALTGLSLSLAVCIWGAAARTDGSEPVTTEIARIGSKIETLSFKDIRGVTRELSELGTHRATVIMFTTTDCPIVNKTLPKLKELYAEYVLKDVAFLCINVGQNDTLQAMASHAIEFDTPWSFVKDYEARSAVALGVLRTPEFVILNRESEICYRGRFDDQFRLGGARPSATRADLRLALDEVLEGKAVSVPQTPVDGCLITFPNQSGNTLADGNAQNAETTKPPLPSPGDQLNFNEHIAPIVFESCAPCHRPSTAAPFSLLTYEDCIAHAEMIAAVVRDETMPPWYATKAHGTFQNNRSLNPAAKKTLLQWLDSSRVQGDPAKAPAPPSFVETPWRIGTPDLILTTIEQHTIPATGFVPYKYVVLPHLFLGETWVEAFEIRPLNSAVVHHCNMAYATSKGASEDTFITGYVPGGQPMDLGRFENSVAYRIPAGAALGLQIHYTTTGKEEKCRIQVGLRFPKKQIRKQLHHFVLDPRGWKIPPGDPAYRIEAKHTLRHDADLLGLFTHMHVRGRDMTFYANHHDGSRETLLQIPNYNFEWQLGYELAPGTKQLAKGTAIEAIAHFDNSSFNPYNPDPTATVEYGPQTVDEMFNGFVFYVDQHESLAIDVNPKTGRVKK